MTNPVRRPAAERSGTDGRGPARSGGTRDSSLRDNGSSRDGSSRDSSARDGTERVGGARSSAARTGGAKAGRSSSGGMKSGPFKSGGGRSGPAGTDRVGSAGASGGVRRAPPKARKALPELKRVQLDAPAPDTVFIDRDGERLTFHDSNLKRVAARILTEKRKAWRYRPFSFPLFTDRGHEQTFHFDFYVYDYEDSVIRLILVIPFESREVWDRVGRFKRQYPMYVYELWTPEKLAFLDGPRGRLEF